MNMATAEIYGLMGLVAAVGLFIAFFMKDRLQHTENSHAGKELSESEKMKKLEHLDAKERIVMNIILRENGSVYQNEIVKETKQSKVKITRILDQLEGKGLIERRRRGMTNVVVLK